LLFYTERKNRALDIILRKNIKYTDLHTRKRKTNIFEKWFENLNLKIEPHDFCLILFVISTLVFLMCMVFKLSILITLFVIFAIFLIIIIFLNFKKSRNINKKEEQLEYFLINLSGNLFSQPNILNCIKKSVNEIEEPLKSDFIEVLDNYSKGLIFKDALKIMIKKNNSKLIEIVLSGFIAASEKGTDISKFINYQIDYIREKKSLKNYINILSTGPKYSSYFIMFIPLISIIAIILINKNFISYYISSLGILVSIYALSSFLTGFFLINRIINNLGKNILIP